MCFQYMSRFLFLLTALSCITAFGVKGQQYNGFRVQGRFLYDGCGEKVILRGVSNPNIWFEKNGTPRYAEIAKTGANVVRIVWETKGSAKDLDAAITNCLLQNMIPMVELHDATGNWSKLQTCVDYWVRADIVEIIQKHEDFILVNIANEVGDGNVSKTAFRTGYIDAVTQMRDAGINVPLIIDGSKWGQDVNMLQSEGPAIIKADPNQNLMFSVHMWWPKMYGYSEQNIVTEITESMNLGLPMIVGEFSQMHGDCDESTITDDNSIAYKTILRECQKTETGYIAWSWFGNCNPLWDMSTNGTYATLYSWGLEVAINNENSIQKTSVRPYFISHGTCNPSTSDIPELENGLTNGNELLSCYPNPTNGPITIEYNLSNESFVKLTFYDLSGKHIKTLVNEKQQKGTHQLIYDTKELVQGLYFYSLQVDNTCSTKKIVLFN